jgi:hypothetical protein
MMNMAKEIELFCTYDEDCEKWLVWFPHPLGGMNVLESFTNEVDARKFWQYEFDNADPDE